jgi:hypothetical protein
MQNRRAFSGFAFAALLLLSSFLLVTNSSLTADAQQITLSVSAKDTGGKFFGPQIVQVVLDGAGIRNADTSPGSLVVNGVNVPLVHLADSRWYAFFADGNTFTSLASSTGFPGSSDGTFWIIGPNGKNLIFPTLPSAFGHNAATNDPSNPNLDLNGDCAAVVNQSDPCVEWPYIRLFNFNENDQVSIRYSGQSVTLNYVRPSPNDVTLMLDRDSYPINAEIIFGLSDYMWNINPVEEDRVAFAFGSGSTEVFYQPSTSLPPASITGLMQSLRFDFKQILSLQGKDGIRFEHTINGMPATVLMETFPNAGFFENFNARADMFAKVRNVQFRFDYFDKSISAGMGSSDASISIGKEEPKTGTQTPEVKEEEGEEERIVPYSLSKPSLVDLLGGTVDTVTVGQPVLVQTTVTNNLDEEQPFVYIVQVKDENDFTVMLTWIKGNMYAENSFSTGISWTPEVEGDYSIEIFVWKSIDEPGILPLTEKMEVTVSAQHK